MAEWSSGSSPEPTVGKRHRVVFFDVELQAGEHAVDTCAGVYDWLEHAEEIRACVGFEGVALAEAGAPAAGGGRGGGAGRCDDRAGSAGPNPPLRSAH